MWEEDPPTIDQLIQTAGEIQIMEEMAHRLKQQEDKHQDKWSKWTLYRELYSILIE